jgi:flagellin
MALVINTNIASMNARRNLDSNQSQLAVSLQRLSSGLRVNSARDDAAGLAISERMTTQIRGMSQSRRNINDAISMVQTSEAALGEMTSLFQRGRELAVQAANASNSASDKTALQAEMSQLIAEVDRISSSAEFNSVKLFDGGSRAASYDTNGGDLSAEQQEIVDFLQNTWLAQGEDMIEQYFGISGDGSDLDITFVEGESYLAAVSFTGYEVASGKAVELSLNIDLEDFLPTDGVNGGPSFVSNDRIIAHELTHAVMARAINMRDMPLWFVEGTAEFIHGADARLNNDLAAMAGSSDAEKVENLMNGFLGNDGSVELYSAGYAAVRYLHSSVIAAGGTGIREVFDYLEANTGSDLDDAIQAMKAAHNSLAYANLSEFEGIFDSGEDGNNYIVNLMSSGSLSNADTGAVGGNDADGGARDTSADGVVPDVSASGDPLTSFNESLPSGLASLNLEVTETLSFQVGANGGETIDINRVAINAGNLGVESVDLTSSTDTAIQKFDLALNAVNSERARLGAIQNRLESASRAVDTARENASASRSRILDADYATETASMVKAQILQQAATGIIAQANALPQNVLSLLQ